MTRDVLRSIVCWLAQRELTEARAQGEAVGICRGFAEGWNAATNHLRAEAEDARAELRFLRAMFQPVRSTSRRERVH